MTLRAVVAVALAGALLAVTLPGLDTGRRDAAAAAVRGELAGLEAAVEDLAGTEDAVPAGKAGARRVVVLELPGRTWTTAGVDRVAIAARRPGNGTDAGAAIVWRLDGGPEHVRRVPGVRIGRPEGATAPLVLSEPGEHRVVLSLVRRDGAPVVAVGRLRFKSENGTTTGHANVPGRRLRRVGPLPV